MRVKKDSEKVGLKLNIPITKIMASGPITSWQIEGEKLETVTGFIFLVSKITADSDCSHEFKRHLLRGRKALTNLDSILKSRDITLVTKVCRVKAMVSAVQLSSVAQLCLTLCNPMECSTPGFPVHHQFLELAHTRVHWLSDAIQPSHPLWSPSPPAFSLSQNQGLFQWVSSSASGGQSIGASVSASVLPMNIQEWLPLGLTSLISLLFKGLSRILSNTTVQKHQFFSAQLSL